jgi:hypothetical protein
MISQLKYNPEFHLKNDKQSLTFTLIIVFPIISQTNATFTGLQDFLAYVVRIQSQTRVKGFNALIARNITALTTAKHAMKLQHTHTQG